MLSKPFIKKEYGKGTEGGVGWGGVGWEHNFRVEKLGKQSQTKVNILRNVASVAFNL